MADRRLSLAAASLLIALAACRKDKDDTPTPSAPNYVPASDEARIEDVFNDMLAQVDNAADANGLRDTDDPCSPTVTFDTIATPHTLTVDFGTENCTALNGRMRRGRLLVTFTGPYAQPGTLITITPQDYYVNNDHVTGSKTVTNMGLDDNGHPYFDVVVDGTLTAGDGSWAATHQAHRTRTWIAGHDTPGILDDVYLITGGGSGVARNGVAYTVAITEGLRVAVACPFITAGTVDIAPASGPTWTVDYGSGACDATFTVTVIGQTYTVTIG